MFVLSSLCICLQFWSGCPGDKLHLRRVNFVTCLMLLICHSIHLSTLRPNKIIILDYMTDVMSRPLAIWTNDNQSGGRVKTESHVSEVQPSEFEEQELKSERIRNSDALTKANAIPSLECVCTPSYALSCKLPTRAKGSRERMYTHVQARTLARVNGSTRRFHVWWCMRILVDLLIIRSEFARVFNVIFRFFFLSNLSTLVKRKRCSLLLLNERTYFVYDSIIWPALISTSRQRCSWQPVS